MMMMVMRGKVSRAEDCDDDCNDDGDDDDGDDDGRFVRQGVTNYYDDDDDDARQGVTG